MKLKTLGKLWQLSEELSKIDLNNLRGIIDELEGEEQSQFQDFYLCCCVCVIKFTTNNYVWTKQQAAAKKDTPK